MSDADKVHHISSYVFSRKLENANTKRSDIKRDTSKDGQEFSNIAAKANEGEQLDWGKMNGRG